MSSLTAMFSPPVVRVIRGEARRAAPNLYRHGYDRQDVEQELALHYLVRRSRFDHSRASAATFAAHVCRRRVLQIVEMTSAGKRGGGGPVVSLSDPLTADGTLTRLDAVSQDQSEIRMGRRSRHTAEMTALRIDVGHTIRKLPPELADVAYLLALGERLVEVARQLQISRSTLHRRIVLLRRAFREAGLHHYLSLRQVA